MEDNKAERDRDLATFADVLDSLTDDAHGMRAMERLLRSWLGQGLPGRVWEWRVRAIVNRPRRAKHGHAKTRYAILTKGGRIIQADDEVDAVEMHEDFPGSVILEQVVGPWVEAPGQVTP